MGLKLITSAQLAVIMGVKERTVTKSRREGKPPSFYKLGRNIRYDLKDVEEFIEKKKGG